MPEPAAALCQLIVRKMSPAAAFHQLRCIIIGLNANGVQAGVYSTFQSTLINLSQIEIDDNVPATTVRVGMSPSVALTDLMSSVSPVIATWCGQPDATRIDSVIAKAPATALTNGTATLLSACIWSLHYDSVQKFMVTANL